MKTTMLAAASLLALTGCAGLGDIGKSTPAVLPGTETGTLRFVNEADETYALSLNRCAEEYQNMAVRIGERNGLFPAPGATAEATLSTGCYIGYVGPNRMTRNIRSVRFEIQAAQQGATTITSSGSVTRG